VCPFHYSIKSTEFLPRRKKLGALLAKLLCRTAVFLLLEIDAIKIGGEVIEDWQKSSSKANVKAHMMKPTRRHVIYHIDLQL